MSQRELKPEFKEKINNKLSWGDRIKGTIGGIFALGILVKINGALIHGGSVGVGFAVLFDLVIVGGIIVWLWMVMEANQR